MRPLSCIVIAIALPSLSSFGQTEEPQAKTSGKDIAWPALAWKNAAPSPFNRVESPAVVFHKKRYLFGGFTDDLGALNHRGRILIVGGRCNSSEPPRNVVGDLLEYDPRADAWRVVGELPEKVLAPAAAIIGDRIVMTGGGLNNPPPLTAATRVAPLPAGQGGVNAARLRV